ncbi:hypothetical protein N7470_009941 [Penicillium chermesinum]|nr:hypothetical protein N7470_009941 [Penicillium chermesinum]
MLGQANGYDEMMTTPPLPSSSPAPGMDTMELSPLPHKPAFVVTTEIEVHSPSPCATPRILQSPQRLIARCKHLQWKWGLLLSKPDVKRRPPFLRPSLARSKAQSFQLGMNRPSPEGKAPPFRFSSEVSKTSLSTSTSLEDMFGDSPPQERTVSRNPSSLAPPRLRPPFHHARSSGSPSTSSIRKPSHPLMRPRKQCRRSLSMYEHPGDVIAEKEAKIPTSAPLQSITDAETAPTLHLPHFTNEDRADSLPRINQSTLLDLLDGKFDAHFDNIMIVDCRFEYDELFDSPKSRTALVLHCEYSAHRAPIMAKYIRHHDRAVNVDTYPHLTYPDMYILDGGYSSFFATHSGRCYPQNYVEMTAKEHEVACERGLGKVKQRSKLNRAQTFAFGQHSPQMEDSPTGPCRFGDDHIMSSPFSLSESPLPNRTPGRRMLSY